MRKKLQCVAWRHGNFLSIARYSRDKRSDCVQVVVALVLTPEGFPVAYEVYPGNTRDTATLEAFLDRIEKQYGKLRRTWLMDRGIPTEETLEKMRSRGIEYLVGTPKGRLTHVEKPLLEQPWTQARESVRVKILQLCEILHGDEPQGWRLKPFWKNCRTFNWSMFIYTQDAHKMWILNW